MKLMLLISEISIVLLAALLMAADLLLPRTASRHSLGYAAAGGVLAVFVFSFTQYGPAATVYQGLFVVDNFAVFFKQLFLMATLLTLLFSVDYVEGLGSRRGEFYALLLLALAGMMVMASSNDLVTVFVGLELMTIVFYILSGFNFNSIKSSEAGMKYMLLGAASSAVFVYGVSWVYGFTGSVALQQISAKAADSPAVLLGIALMLAGLCFKLAVTPFHMWAPDVYEGAPTPITAILAMGSKAASLAILLRIFLVAFAGLQSYWLPVTGALAAFSMVGGTIVAMRQTNIKRMMGYSSVAQAGYMLVGLMAADAAGVKGMLFYTMLYVFANVGVFAVVVAVSRHSGAEDIADFSGLAQQAPFLALTMTAALLSMAGIPPMAGFVGKFYIFMAIMEQGYWGLAALGFVMSMVSVYYYLLVVRTMYVTVPGGRQPLVVSRSLQLAALVSFSMTLLIGIYPAPLASLSNIAARALW